MQRTLIFAILAAFCPSAALSPSGRCLLRWGLHRLPTPPLRPLTPRDLPSEDLTPPPPPAAEPSSTDGAPDVPAVPAPAPPELPLPPAPRIPGL